MSLQNYLQQRNQTMTLPTGQTGSLSNFLQQNKLDTKPKTVFKPKEKEEKKSKLKSAFRWLGKQLMKPVGSTAKELRGVGEFTGHLLSIASPRISASEGLKKAGQEWAKSQQGILDVLSGKEETSFRKEFEDVDKDLSKLEKTMSIGADFVLDPLWFAKPVKVVKRAGKIVKLDKPAKVLAKSIKGLTPVRKLKMLFSTTTGNKEFDAVVNKFRNLKEYREGRLIDEAVNLQKDIVKYKKAGVKNIEEIITEGLENKASLAKIKDSKVLNIVSRLDKKYKGLLDYSRKIGLEIGEIAEYAPHIRTKESFLNILKKEFSLGAREFGKGSIEKGRKLQGTIKELEEQGIKIFEKNPAIQLAKKGQAYAKAITSKEFTNEVKKFAIKDGIEVSNPMLKGLKFADDQAKVIDNFYQGIKPEELKVIVKTFDNVQNWWKGQALVAPSYHLRNTVGNIWNNYLANVNPYAYAQAMRMQKNPAKFSGIIDEMKKLGVINEGWYAKDISEEVLQKVSKVGNWKIGMNPVKQQNYLFQLNKWSGSLVENNARMAHYLSKKAGGMSAEKAAESVKKYLFDYGNLTSTEKNIFKRAIPFYTWTRKNLPLQLEGLITQPAKYALPHKIIQQIESGVEVPNEKYMSPYITENVPVRIKKDDKGNTMYFLLGNWLPYASAIDILSQPLDTLIGMATPLLKTPIELWANQSTYFKDTLGQYSKIERTHKQQGEFMGQLSRKKNILLLRNIRILNDMNRWIDKKDPTATQNSYMVKILHTLFGKAATYDVGKAKYFYDKDTDERMYELKKAIKSALKKGYKEKANELKNELQEFMQIRK
ncbi:MAG: hypothetical protein U9P90_02580 [Patescibacteria group bacterium]|nr:hypothetical protein [Patescibacteria group bacterium]